MGGVCIKKAVFIYNPASGDQTVPGRLDYIIEKFQSKNIILQPYRMYCGDDDNLVHVLKSVWLDFAVISGGDGTLNKVVNILLKNDIRLPIGIIPSGTCNDFARSLNLPSALEFCLDVILKGNIAEVDIGLINEKDYFLGTCAGGFIVDVSFNTDSELKRNFGPFAYYLKALNEVNNKHSFRIEIKTENEVIKKEVLMFMVLNGKTAGGFSNIVKDADYSDGIMDIVLIRNCSHLDLANLLFMVLNNEFSSNKNVTLLRSRTCSITGPRDVPISLDGEKGDGLPLSIRFLNKEMRIFVDSVVSSQ
jgi:diacylglycerol kinase (ATP)